MTGPFSEANFALLKAISKLVKSFPSKGPMYFKDMDSKILFGMTSLLIPFFIFLKKKRRDLDTLVLDSFLFKKDDAVK